MTAASLRLTRHGVEGIDEAMEIMTHAFDARYGEAWTAAQCQGVLAMPGATLVIARMPEPVGFALIRAVAGEAELMLIGVLPEVRSNGIGARLIEETIAIARQCDCRRYFLEVRSDNMALGLYRRHGFEQIGERRNYYRGNDGKMRNALTFRTDLA